MVPPGGWQNLTQLHSNLGASSPAPMCTPRRTETCPHSNLNTHIHNTQRVQTARVSPSG